MYQALRNKTPPLRKSQIFGRGGSISSFFDSGKPSGLLFFPKSQNEIRAGFYLFQKNRPLRGRVYIRGIFYKEIPTNNPIFPKFSRALRARAFIKFKIFRALRARVFILSNFLQISRGLLLSSIFDFQKAIWA